MSSTPHEGAQGAPLVLDEPMRQAIRASAERATREGRTRWLACTWPVETPDLLPLYATSSDRDRFLWQCGATGEAFFAEGVADEIESAGSDRFEDVACWRRELVVQIDRVGLSRSPDAPLCLGGFGFDPESRAGDAWKAFPAARFVLPALLVERAALTAFVRVEPGASPDGLCASLGQRLETLARRRARLQTSPPTVVTASGEELDLAWPDGPEYRVRSDRPHAIFRGQVERALEAFATGALEKVVLARSLRIDHDGCFDVPAFLGRLRGIYPGCTLIAVGRGDDTFLAATPETLVRVRGASVETAALAGSAPRGREPEEDVALGRALLDSAKERAEHAHVVAAIRAALEPRCAVLEMPEGPSLRPLFGIQHLETRIRGRLRENDRDVLRLVASMHPTPAVGGVPRAAAIEWLKRFEGLDRGWYAAPVGWLDAQGGGDFRVALRSGLIRNGVGSEARGSARLFAGAGLVEGSVPEQELTETRIKLRALLAPLTEI